MIADCVTDYFNAWNARDADAVLATLGETGTYRDPTTPGALRGAALRAHVAGLWTAFPDLRFEVTNAGAVGPNKYAAQWTMRGTNTGSMRGLPPSNAEIDVEGADFFEVNGDTIATVEGYFDTAAVPRQIGLDVITQPRAIGPFRFGLATAVQTGRTQVPGAISITFLEAADDDAVTLVRDGSRDTLVEMMGMEGFIGATTATLGMRMVTISAWASPEDSRQLLAAGGAHATAMKDFYAGKVAKAGMTSVWAPHRMNPFFTRCPACHKMHADPAPASTCDCGAPLPDQLPYW